MFVVEGGKGERGEGGGVFYNCCNLVGVGAMGDH